MPSPPPFNFTGLDGTQAPTGNLQLLDDGSGTFGVLTLGNTQAPPNPVAGMALYSKAGILNIKNPQGNAQFVGGSMNQVGASPVTVANTAAETILQQVSMPASDAIAGAVYRMWGFGVYSDTLTPTLAWGLRWGGVGGTSLATIPATTLGSGVSNLAWYYELVLSFVTPTTVNAVFDLDIGTSNATGAVTPLLSVNGASPVTIVTNITQVWCSTVTWSAASASNTITLTGGYTERVA